MNKLNSCEEIVVYGFAVAGWNEVRDIVFQSGRICYGYSIDEANQRGANGRNFFPVGPGFSSSPEDSNLAVKRQCKQMLTAIVAENCLREREGRSVIPVIFCLESNLCPLLPPEAIADKKHPASGDIGKIGSAEIRRMFKLCTEEDLPEEVRLTARKTFIL